MAGVQFGPGWRGQVRVHGGGAAAVHVLTGRPHQTTEAAAGEGEQGLGLLQKNPSYTHTHTSPLWASGPGEE